MTEGFDAGTYGRSFADVYDAWYPPDAVTVSAVDFISSLCRPGARILELGIGTGRLAIPLAKLGYVVSGIDSSPEMLGLLDSKAAKCGVEVNAVCGDASSPGVWPDGPFDVIIAAFNFLFNLIDDAVSEQLLEHAGARLTEHGSLVIETSVPMDLSSPANPDHWVGHGANVDPVPPVRPIERHLEVKDVSPDAVVLIASSTDHRSGVVTGQHIELRDGQPVRLRPWQVRVTHPDQIDSLASRAGLRLLERFADWNRSAFEDDSVQAVGRYVLSSPTPE